VAKLQDGRILIIEYKGEHIADSQDTKEKENIGLIWEKQSEGRGLFLLAVKDKNGKNIEKQLKEKINHGGRQ
jgi:type III restriction enzyme